jgi:hypothetical protein
MKLTPLSSLFFSEKNQPSTVLRQVPKNNCFLWSMRLSEANINANILFHKVIGNMYGAGIVTKQRCGGTTRYTKISQQPSKPYNLWSSGRKCSKFCLYTRMRHGCLLLRLPCKRRTRKNEIACDRAMIHWVTCPSGVGISMKLKHTINTKMMSLLSISAHN